MEAVVEEAPFVPGLTALTTMEALEVSRAVAPEVTLQAQDKMRRVLVAVAAVPVEISAAIIIRQAMVVTAVVAAAALDLETIPFERGTAGSAEAGAWRTAAAAPTAAAEDSAAAVAVLMAAPSVRPDSLAVPRQLSLGFLLAAAARPWVERSSTTAEL
jgi:hypothetical protein